MTSPTKTLLATIEVEGKQIPKRNRPARFGEEKHKPWTALIIEKLVDARLHARHYRGAFRIDCEFRFARPKGHFGKGRRSQYLLPSAPKRHTVKPDRDNLDKAVLDALTQSGFWGDDSQASDGRIQKRYCVYDCKATREAPGCTITIWTLED